MKIDDELLAKASKPDSTPDALEFVIRHADPLSQALEDAIRLGAEGGDALAQAQLAERFRRGDGVPRDDRMAFRWALAAAEQGLAGAQLFVAMAFFQGLGTEQDVRQAYFWMAVARERDPDVEGFIIMTFLDVGLTPEERDALHTDARDWWSRSDAVCAAVRERAERGDAEAQLQLSNWYSQGTRLPKDEREGLRWVLRAAECGHPEAQAIAGWGLFLGFVGSVDKRRAYFWLVLASARNPEHEVMRDAVGSELTAEERDAVHAEARDWAPRQ